MYEVCHYNLTKDYYPPYKFQHQRKAKELVLYLVVYLFRYLNSYFVAFSVVFLHIFLSYVVMLAS